MTPAEAIAALEAADPERSYCVSIEEWKYAELKKRETRYNVSVLPGADGSACQAFRNAPLPVLVAQAIASLSLTQTQRAIEQVAAQLEGGK